MLRSEQSGKRYVRRIVNEVDAASTALVTRCVIGNEADAFSSNELERISEEDAYTRDDILARGDRHQTSTARSTQCEERKNLDEKGFIHIYM
jgi:hypothetical protein